MRFEFIVSGVKEFDRAFNRIGEHVSDLRPIWPELTRELFTIEDEQFKSAGSKGRSGQWKELSAAYAKRKAIDYPGKPILQRTGKMMQSLTSKTGDTILVEEKDEYGFGTRLFYATYHQTGTPKMAARELVSLNEDSRRRITKAIQKGLLAIIKADRQVTQSVEVE